MFSADTSPSVRARVLLVLGVAVAAISAAPILVRGIADADPMAIAFWRTLAVGLLLAPGLRRVSLGDALRIGIAGAALAAHFSVWFASIHQTTVMRSTVLVCTGPIWVGILEWGVLRTPPRARYWAGMAVAILGVLVMGLGEPPSGEAGLQGDLLAILGAIFVAVYLLLGRSVRARVSIGTYASAVCLSAAACLLPVLLVTGAPLVGFGWTSALLIAGLALGPQLLGHNGFNFALRWLPASIVSACTLLEPVGATLLAMVFYGEVPSVFAAVGALLSLAGVLLATLVAPESSET